MAREKWTPELVGDQTGRVMIVTGATSGIGKETARVLVGKNAHVILAVRNQDKGQAALTEFLLEYPKAEVEVRTLDLSNLSSIEAFAEGMARDFDRLDVLVNNAGVMMCPYGKTADGFEMQIGTNHMGHFALTGQLMPLLKATPDSRVVNVSSVGHRTGKIDLNDLNWEARKYSPSQAYGDSKIANIYFTYELKRRYAQDPKAPKVTVAHPGWTTTDLQRHSGMFRFLNPFFGQGVDMGALPTLRAALDPQAESGDYYGPGRHFEMHGHPVKVASNRRSHDEAMASALWDKSAAATGVAY